MGGRASRAATSAALTGVATTVAAPAFAQTVTLVWSGGMTLVLLKLVGAWVPLRVSHEQELEGPGISQYREALQ